MAFLEWNDEFLTGIDAIDTEHHWLIDSINQFHDLYLQGDPHVIQVMVADLSDYICEHFKNEEGLMVKYNYPERDNHIKEHKKLAVRVRDIEDRLRVEGIVSASELSGFIIGWVTDHILKTDRAFGEFVRTVGEV